MRTMQIYTKEGCSRSEGLRELLNERGVTYEETVVKLDSPEHHELGARAGSMRLPQAFIGYIPVGSAEEVQAAHINGMLDDLLVD